MTIKVLFFASLRRETGEGEVERSFEGRESVTVGEVLELVYREWPAVKGWDGSLLVAVDEVYATRDEAVRDGQTVAVMPPVQGG